MNKVHVMLPSYNEQEAIENVLRDCLSIKDELNDKYSLGLTITVIDDGSRDNTTDRVLSMKSDGDINLVCHETNKGLGEGVKTAIQTFLSQNKPGDFMVVMDADFTHKAKYIPDLVEKHKKTNADVVIASRFISTSQVHGVSLLRNKLSSYSKLYNSIFLGIRNVRDYTCGYRLYTYSALDKLHKRFKGEILVETGFTCMVDLLYRLKAAGAAFEEIPFSLRYDDKKGASKMKVFRNTIKSLMLPFKLKIMVRQTEQRRLEKS